jgi:ribosomal protein S18 acetylase RimI-like enzyme
VIPPKTTTGTLRRLVPADAPEYRELMLQAYAQHPDAFTSSAEERAALPLSWWQARLSAAPDAHDLVVGAWDDEMLVGAAGVSFEPRVKGRHKATLFGLYVLPAFRHAGWGARIVEAGLAAARARDGVKLMQLTVTGGNAAARALYERAGFVAFGVEPFAVAVDGGYVDKVHMWCDLGLGLPATARDRGRSP